MNIHFKCNLQNVVCYALENEIQTHTHTHSHTEERGDGPHLKEKNLADEKHFKKEAIGLISGKIYSTATNYSSI